MVVLRRAERERSGILVPTPQEMAVWEWVRAIVFVLTAGCVGAVIGIVVAWYNLPSGYLCNLE